MKIAFFQWNQSSNPYLAGSMFIFWRVTTGDFGDNKNYDIYQMTFMTFMTMVILMVILFR